MWSPLYLLPRLEKGIKISRPRQKTVLHKISFQFHIYLTNKEDIVPNEQPTLLVLCFGTTNETIRKQVMNELNLSELKFRKKVIVEK